MMGMALFGKPTPEEEARAQAYGTWIRQRNLLALIAVVLGVFSLTHFGAVFVDSLAAIVLGVMALRQLNSGQSPEPFGHRLAWLAIATGMLSLCIGGFLYFHGRS
jgi:hypothetical protein